MKSAGEQVQSLYNCAEVDPSEDALGGHPLLLKSPGELLHFLTSPTHGAGLGEGRSPRPNPARVSWGRGGQIFPRIVFSSLSSSLRESYATVRVSVTQVFPLMEKLNSNRESTQDALSTAKRRCAAKQCSAGSSATCSECNGKNQLRCQTQRATQLSPAKACVPNAHGKARRPSRPATVRASSTA